MIAPNRRFEASDVVAVLKAGAVALVLALSSPPLAYAKKHVQPRSPLSLQQVRALVDAMKVTPGFPLQVNDLVVARLNTVVMDQGLRRETRGAIARMKSLMPDLRNAVTTSGHPIELLAIPLVESSYRNLPPSPKNPQSAGLWQFVPWTARSYGLVVRGKVDQRLDVTLATDAAMRLLGDNRLRFDDWLLSIAAFNQGEGVVQKAIATGKTRDPWALVASGHLNDYLVVVTAAAIIIGHPHLVD